MDLTKREFDLLAVLAEHKTAVLSRAQLLELVWGYDFAADTYTCSTRTATGGAWSGLKAAGASGFAIPMRGSAPHGLAMS